MEELENAVEADKVDELVVWLMESLQTGQDFIVEQSPEVIQQLILWNRVSWGGCGFVLCALALLGLWVSWKLLHPLGWLQKEWKEGNSDLSDFVVPLEFVVSAITMTIIVGAGCCLLTFVKWCIAPKLCVLEYLMKLV